MDAAAAPAIHRITVETFEGIEFTAVCSCGYYRSKVRYTQARAAGDGNAHVRMIGVGGDVGRLRSSQAQ